MSERVFVLGRKVSKGVFVLGRKVSERVFVLGRNVSERVFVLGRKVSERVYVLGRKVSERVFVLGRKVSERVFVLGRKVSERVYVLGVPNLFSGIVWLLICFVSILRKYLEGISPSSIHCIFDVIYWPFIFLVSDIFNHCCFLSSCSGLSLLCTLVSNLIISVESLFSNLSFMKEAMAIVLPLFLV